MIRFQKTCRSKLLCASLLCAAALLAPGTVLAQIVNVQSLVGKPVQPGLSGNVVAALDWQSGNTALIAASATATAFFRNEAWLTLATVSGAYGRRGELGQFEELPYQQKIFEHLRLRRSLSQNWSAETFTQHEFDRWRRLKFRALAGAGGRLDLAPAKALRLVLGLAYMAQWEQLLKPTADDPRDVVLEHRLSSYVTGGWQLSEGAALVLTVYAQPNLLDFGDVRGLVDAALTVSLTKRLQLKVVYGMGYDTKPPKNVHHYDASTKLALAAEF